PTFTSLRLLREVIHAVPEKLQVPEPCRGANCRDCSQTPMRAMKCQKFCDINRRDAVPIGHHESFISDVGREPLYAPSSHGVKTCFGQRHRPIYRIALVPDNITNAEVNGYVTAQRQLVNHPLLNVIAPITQGKHEVIESVRLVLLHN